MKHDPKLARALGLVQRLMKLSDDQGLRLRAAQIEDRLKLPMTVVLAKVPGANAIEKAKVCGVTRQAFYQWLQGISRPSMKHARKLAQITGYDAQAIRGRIPRSRPNRQQARQQQAQA